MVILTTKIYIQQPLKNSTLPWHHQTTWLILILATIVNFYFWAMPFYYIYNPQNHPDEFLKRNGSVFSGGLKRSGSILSKNE